MNGIENIVQRIIADGQAEADAILADAKLQADAILADWEEKAQKESADILSRGEQAAAERAARLESVAELEGRKLILQAKQETISLAFDEALKKLLALPQEKKVEVLSALCAKAAVTGTEEVLFSPADRDTVGKAVVDKANSLLAGKGKLTLSSDIRPLQGGFVLRDQGVEVNCGFDTLVRLARPDLERQVAGILFDE